MKKTLKNILTLGSLLMLSLILVACGDGSSEEAVANPEAENSENFIANREITGLIFMSDGDVYSDIPEDIQSEIQAQTGITLNIQGVGTDDSQEALAAGLAAGDLPDFIVFNLDNSGRPEMQLLLNAANQGMFHDIAPYLEESDIYGKYFEEGYLPVDTAENIMFRDEWDGASYLVHRNIPRHGGEIDENQVGGLWMRGDIAEDLGIDPESVNTSEDLRTLAEEIHTGDYTDVNGNPVTPLGPTQWGGTDRRYIYQDISWSGDSYEKFFPDESGEIIHESQTPYMMEKIEYVQNLMADDLMHPEYYTMDEPRAQEGILNESFAIVSDMNSTFSKVEDGTYVKLGPIQRVDGTNHLITRYKSGYAGWAVPATTDAPEEVVAFADWLASEEGKLLWNYGIEGEDYDLDENGYPVIHEEVLAELENDPDAAAARGFAGVGNNWGAYLGSTDLAHEENFGEPYYGFNATDGNSTGTQVANNYYEDKMDNIEVIDGMTPKSFLNEFEGSDGTLTTALDRYEENLVRAYYASSLEEAEEIMQGSIEGLEAAGLQDYQDFINQKQDEGIEFIY